MKRQKKMPPIHPGEVLLEDGATGYLDREQLTKALLPTVASTIEMSSLVGGQPQAIHFYDGNDKDVFVLSVGLHHFLCIVFVTDARHLDARKSLK